jgi:hypothetical protein
MLILLFQLGITCLRKSNRINKLVRRSKWDLIYGQIINIMAPIVLPWAFLILKSGLRDRSSKINTTVYYLVFFICLVFPIYYFFDLLQ